MTSALGVAIIGCGLIGRKRAAALGTARLVACVDLVPERAEALAATVPGAQAFAEWREVVGRADVDLVIVSTLNHRLAEISEAAVAAGKHVLVEKPAGKTAGEISRVMAAAQRTGRQVRVGFNHRYHPGLRKAKELVDQGAVGELMFVRGRYGHGGRLGYEKEWRANPELSGGGELIDQGVHLIDLSRWFLGEFTDIQAHVGTYFWNMPVDDNAFMILGTADHKTAFLHVSCSEWKNLFCLEIYGRTGKIQIDGLGGSYGVEKATYYRMLPQMGPPEISQWEYPGPDMSWALEFAEFLEDIRLNRQPAASLVDAHKSLAIVDNIYKNANIEPSDGR
jgi:predicted dehydrogenase